MDLALPSERPPLHRTDSHRSASLGIRSRCVCPASDISSARKLPDDVAAAIRPAVATQPTRSALVVSHHFGSFLRAKASSLLHPEAGRGSLRFQVSRPSMADRSRRPVGLGSLSRNAFHTPRRIPLVCSRTASPRPLPSCRSAGHRPPEHRSARTDPYTAPTSRRCKGSPLPKRWVCRLPRRRGSRVCPVSRSPRCARQTILATLLARNTLTHADPSCRRSDWAGPAAPRCLRSEELGP